eukprot:5828148-Amphidinium_carterae.1
MMMFLSHALMKKWTLNKIFLKRSAKLKNVEPLPEPQDSKGIQRHQVHEGLTCNSHLKFGANFGRLKPTKPDKYDKYGVS